MKRYADEAGAAEIRALDTLVVSALTLVEVPAALWRKQRIGELDGEAAALLVGRFEAEVAGRVPGGPSFVVVAVTARIVDAAATLTGTRGLRAFDAVQLATALAVRQADPACVSFACFDRGLRAAAIAEGLAVVPASLS